MSKMKSTPIIVSFILLLLISSFLLSTQATAKHVGPMILVIPKEHHMWFWNVGNETIYNFTFSLHLTGGIFGHVNKQAKGFIDVFPINDRIAIDYVSLNNPFGFGPVDLNVSISCDKMSGIPYTSYHGDIWFHIVAFSENDARILPIQG